MNDHTIALLLDIADPDSSITDIHIDGHTKFITVSKNVPHDLFCPLYGSRLHSKGRFKRHPNDQILQDVYLINLTVIGRRWKCSNPDCSYTCTDWFDFLEKKKTNLQDHSSTDHHGFQGYPLVQYINCPDAPCFGYIRPSALPALCRSSPEKIDKIHLYR